MAVWTDDGCKAALDDVLTTTFRLRLAQNDPNGGVWDNTLTLGSFTEATFTGYASASLAGFPAAAVAAHVAASTAGSVSFTITAGAQNIYGWYLTDNPATKLYACGRDSAAPVALSSTGTNVYTVTITLKAKDTAT